MAENSKIEWTHHTFNPWRGCTKVSEGCKNCYAETLSKRNPGTLGKWGPLGDRVIASDSYWQQPFKWDRLAREAGERHRVFCASLADVFEGPETMPKGSDQPVTMAFQRLLRVIFETPHLDWLLLTKRPENWFRHLCIANNIAWGRPTVQSPFAVWVERWMMGEQAPPNIWLGTSVENQETADERIPQLLKCPAAVRFLSCEPLLGPIDLGRAGFEIRIPSLSAPIETNLHWVIVGGESGPGARPMHPDWPRSLRDQCRAVPVPYFFKQWGEWIGGKFDRAKGKMVCESSPDHQPVGRIFWTNPGEPRVHLWDESDHYWRHASARVGKHAAGRLLDGRVWNEFPCVPAVTSVPAEVPA